MFFKIHIHPIPAHGLIEIDFIAIKFRAIDTSEFGDALTILA